MIIWLFPIPRKFLSKSPIKTLWFPIDWEFPDDSVVVPHYKGIPQGDPFSVKKFHINSLVNSLTVMSHDHLEEYWSGQYATKAIPSYRVHLPSNNGVVLDIDVEEELNERGNYGDSDDYNNDARDFDDTRREV